MTAGKPGFKAGFAVLVGRTNVGKSTLLNALVGRKVTIVTPKPQTTRYTIHGIVHRPEGQIVLVDTPGFFKTTPSKLVDTLHQRARNALVDIDVVVHVVDPSRAIGPEDDMVTNLLWPVDKPKLLCLNKMDLRDLPFREAWLTRAAQYATVVEVSALTGKHLESLIDRIFCHLPEGQPLYPEHQFTNITTQFWIAEVVREKVYALTGQEVPYRTRVELDTVEERTDKAGKPLLFVKAAILTPNDHYQRMLIGAGGAKIKHIGSAARQELEELMHCKVFLDLAVLVDHHLF